MVRLAVLTFAALALACTNEARTPSIATLDRRFEPLRADFDADAGHVRLLAILSPT